MRVLKQPKKNPDFRARRNRRSLEGFQSQVRAERKRVMEAAAQNGLKLYQSLASASLARL